MQNAVAVSEVLDLTEYEKVRPAFRAEVLAEKERRRVRVGDHFTFLFENRRSVLYQIQEMLRIERIVEERAIAHEVETYNELLPPPGGLGATLLLEYEQRETRAVVLRELLGLERHVWLHVGQAPPVAGVFDRRQMGSERLSSVQYVTFPLEEAHRAAWHDAAAAGALKLVVNHPRYSHEAVLSPDVAAALAEDFAG